jgi:uncharacterized protein
VKEHEAMHFHGIEIAEDALTSFCMKWKVRELSLFGSILRDDFGPESDIDILVTFEPEAPWSLWDLMDMQEELQRLTGRPIDLIEKEGLRNPFRRKEILTTNRVIYAA